MRGGVNREGSLKTLAQRGRTYYGGGLTERGRNRTFTLFSIIFLHLAFKSF